jgi:DNA topoisomerase VI subunit A
MKATKNLINMNHVNATRSAKEIDLLKRVKEEFQIEKVASGGLSSLRQQFLNDTIGLLNLALMDDDDEFSSDNQ